MLTLAQSTSIMMGEVQRHTHEIVEVRQEIQALKEQRVIGTGYVTILGYARKHKYDISKLQAQVLGRRLVRACHQRGLEVSQVPDERWGVVNSYPETLLDDLWPYAIGQ